MELLQFVRACSPKRSRREHSNNVSWPVSRVLFGDLHLRDSHSSGTPIARRLVQPTRVRGLKTGSMPDVSTRMRSLLFGLAPGGVCRAAAVTSTRGALLPPRFTLTARNFRSGRRFVFCGTFPGVAPAGRYPAPFLAGARTFLPCTVAHAAAVARPSGGSALGGLNERRQPVLYRNDRMVAKFGPGLCAVKCAIA